MVAKKSARNVQAVQSVSAAVGGLNVRDPISNMPPTDAYAMENWIPQQYGLKVRRGYAEWRIIGTGAEVKSIFNYFPNTTTVSGSSSFTENPTQMPGNMFAATDAAIYDVTTATLVAPAVSIALSGTTDAGRFSTANFSNAAGTWLLACSEADGYFTFNGAAWLKVTMGGGANQVSVGDPTKFVCVAVWKRRVWFVEKNSSKVWYLAADAIYGAAAAVDVGSLLKKGGAIAWISTWTIDAGDAIDDFLVICSENGEVLIYKGTDPTSATTFGLVGRWEVGQVPKGRRGFCQMGGDLLILSTLGISPLSYVTRGGAQMLAASQRDYTSKISRQFNQDLAQSYNRNGWALQISTREGLLIVTVPSSSYQYSMTIQNGSWTELSGMQMRCTYEVAGWVFFGSATGKVYIAFIGYTDNQTLAGHPGMAISAVVHPAFNGFNQPAQIKHFLLAKLSFLATKLPTLSVAMNVDFKIDNIYPSVPQLPSSLTGDIGVWDTGVWDDSVWAGASQPFQIWQNIPNLGAYGSLSITSASTGELILTNIDYVFEKGGIL